MTIAFNALVSEDVDAARQLMLEKRPLPRESV